MGITRDITFALTTVVASMGLTACAATAVPHRATLAASSSAGSKAATSASGHSSPARLVGQLHSRKLLAAGNPHDHAFVPRAARAENISHPNQVVGTGDPASCTSAAVVRAVARGGIITFNCGPKPVTIVMNATAKVVNTSNRVVLDGGGLVTLSGGGKHEILYMDTCDHKQILRTNDCINQEWPQLVVQNMTFEDGYSPTKETAGTPYGGGGGGAIYAEGGQLKVVNSLFIDNRCFAYGPDLGGAAIRAITQWRSQPVYITSDIFQGGRCSNGSALSSIDSSWDIINSVMTDNKAIGWGANPPQPGTRGGGSGGAIYTDGDNYNVLIDGSIINDNYAREGGGGIFFVVDNNRGTLTIEDSMLHNNPSGEFSTAGYPGIFFHSSGHPIVINSIIN
jgi:hypothetical protein